jgi:hypothetical protein
LVVGLGRFEVGCVALGAEECVECERDDVAVLDTVVRGVAADAPLELESLGDGVVDLTSIAFPQALPRTSSNCWRLTESP